MIKKYLPVEEARLQLEGFGTGSWVKKNGKHVTWESLLVAQQTYIDHYNKWDLKQRSSYWIQEIGVAQLLLPMHVFQEYCQPDRYFHPVPNFREKIILTRKLPDWFVLNNVGKKFVIIGGSTVYGIYQDGWTAANRGRYTADWLKEDHAALTQLYGTRLQQQRELVTELISVDRSPIQQQSSTLVAKKQTTEQDIIPKELVGNIGTTTSTLLPQQLGWNCFDIAVGLDAFGGRKALVSYALSNSSNPAFRLLLAPEIKHAAALTAIYMNSKLESEKQLTKRIIELFEIAKALRDPLEQAQVESCVVELSDKEESKLLELAINALPLSMHAEELRRLVNTYTDAHEQMKAAVAACNVAIGKTEGNYLSLFALGEYFSHQKNKIAHEGAYEAFNMARAAIYVPAEHALNAYCHSQAIYEQYVQDYYGTNQWFAFQPNVSEPKAATSMVDVVAMMLNTVIVIHQNVKDIDREIYRTTNTSSKVIEIQYNGHNHFWQRPQASVSLAAPKAVIFSAEGAPPATSSSPQPALPAISQVNIKELQTFLNHVVAGQQDEAEAMLKQNPTLALASGTVTDHAKRTFSNITGFQYAVWALDWHMWCMIKKHLDKNFPGAAKAQLEGVGSGYWVKEHGKHAIWQKLIDHYKTCMDNYFKWTAEQRSTHFIQQIGVEQLILPMHVLQEYCHPNRPFEPAPPNFRDNIVLVRKLPDWLTLDKIGKKCAMYWGTQWISGDMGTYGGVHSALIQLFNTRLQQRNELVAELDSGVKPPQP